MQENRDNKPWEGQLYLCHSSEIVCKLLYKKFFRKLDTTVIYGHWKHVLLQQQKALDVTSSRTDMSMSPDDFDPTQELLQSPPPRIISPKLDQSQSESDLPTFLSSSLHGNGGIPNSISSSSYSNLPPLSLYERRQKKLNLSQHERSKYVATSKHGLISPAELDPIQCLVIYYTSSWRVPKAEASLITRVFGSGLVHKIEQHIREEFNGEQTPGTSFVLETGKFPCQYVVCTCIAKEPTLLSTDYSYNSFRASLLAIYNYNRAHKDKLITTILCPALETISVPPYNLVHQMAVCYEYWDWHMHKEGTVLPFTHKDEEEICKHMRQTSPNLFRISQDLESFIKLGLIVSRGLVYDMELQVLLGWLTDTGKSPKPAKRDMSMPQTQQVANTDLPKHVLAQALVDVLKKPDAPPFTLTPLQICIGITGEALETILGFARDNKIKIFDEIDPKQLQYGEVLAHGTSGSVSKAMWNETAVAVKTFFSYQPELFFNELTMITLVRHPKLVEAIGGYYDKNNAIIVTELLDTNLCQFLQTKELSVRLKVKIAMDIAESMQFLHSRNIIHRDLKSVNVLLNIGLDIVAKVCDFGLSRVADSTSTMTGNIGTVSWIAPEIFENKRYTEKCDVYSFGIILHEILTQTLPYKDIPTFKIPMVVMKGQRPTISSEAAASVPKEYIELMKQCWHENPVKRPSFSVIIEKLAGMAPPEPTPKPIPGASSESDTTSDMDDNQSTSSGTLTGSTTEQENLALDELKTHYKRSRPLMVTDDLMRKCLRVKGNKVVAAKQVIRNYLEWYQLFNMGKPLKITDVKRIFEAGILYFIEGVHDAEGRTLILLDFSNWDIEKPTEPEIVKALMYAVERCSDKPESQTKGIVLICLLNNFQTYQVSFRLVNSIFSIIRKSFPMNLKKILAVNPPPFFSRFLTMYQVFIKSTMKLIENIPQDKLNIYIEPQNILSELGGKLRFDMGKYIRSRYEAEGIEYI